ncbi:hypothetical protein BH18ACT9_BH18ACT9_15020 [soil metagenome]
MNKSQLIDTMAERFDNNRKAAAHALESVIETITREVAKGEKVAITGFGSFEKRVRDARWVRNPRTGERLKAKKTAVPKFNAGADLKRVVSGAKKAAATGAKNATAATKSTTSKTTSGAKKTATKSSAAAKKTATKATGKAPAKKTTRKATAKTTAKAPAKKAAAKTTAKTTRKTPAKTPAKTSAKKTTKKS